MLTSKPVNARLLRLIPPMGIALILGSEGSGKSVLGYGILESLKDTGRKLLVYNLPMEKSVHLPDWIGITYDMDFPEESIVLADEAYLVLHSRDSMKAGNKFMDIFSGVVRQKDILAIYITQFSRKLDIGIVSSPRVLLIKQPSLLQMRLDRSELRSILADATISFKTLEKQPPPKGFVLKIQKTGHDLGAETAVNPRCLIGTYVVSNNFEGMIDMSNVSPSFWSEDLSKAWKGVSLIQKEVSMPRGKNISDAGFLDTFEPSKSVVATFWQNYHGLEAPFELDEDGTKLKAELTKWAEDNKLSVNPKHSADIDRFVMAAQKTGRSIVPWARNKLFAQV